MTQDSIDGLIDRLDQLLDAERRALLAGEIDTLSTLHEGKEGLISKLNALDRDEAEQLKDVQTKLTRNQVLLSSAMDGIRSVADRMTELRLLRQSLATYGRDGKRQQFETPVSQKLEKRA